MLKLFPVGSYFGEGTSRKVTRHVKMTIKERRGFSPELATPGAGRISSGGSGRTNRQGLESLVVPQESTGRFTIGTTQESGRFSGWIVHDEGLKENGEHWVWVKPGDGDEEAIPILITRKGEDPDKVARWMSRKDDEMDPDNKAMMLLYGDPSSAENRGKVAALKRKNYNSNDIMILGENGDLYRSDGSLFISGFVGGEDGGGEKPILQLAQGARKIRRLTGRSIVVDPVEEQGTEQKAGKSRVKGGSKRDLSGVSMKMDVRKGSIKKDTSGKLERLRDSVLKKRPGGGRPDWENPKSNKH
jgi:hypothetical protein